MAHDIPIWQVARATSAAPTYFKPPVIDGLEYVDGGFGANNPCAEIYEEVRRMNNNSRRCVSIILSIGTGKNSESRRFKGTGFQRYLNYANFARKWASDSEKTHEAMLKAKSEVHFNYFRLNVEKGLDLMKLDDWRARGPVRTKIGERIGNFRSSSTKDRRKGSEAAGVVDGQEADILNEECGNLQNGNGTIHTSGNGSMNHAGQQTSNEPGEQINDRKHALDATTNTSTTHLECPVKDAKNQAFDQPNGHSPATLTSARQVDPNTDDTNIPEWFRHKNRTLESIREYTEAYLSQPDTIEMIEQCAKLLVEGRRGRARSDQQRWEKACFGTWYQVRTFWSEFFLLIPNWGHIPLFCAHFGGFILCLVASLGCMPLFQARFGLLPPGLVANLGHIPLVKHTLGGLPMYSVPHLGPQDKLLKQTPPTPQLVSSIEFSASK